MSKTLLIDGNSLGYRCHYATKLSSGGMETQAVFGFLKTLRDLRLTYQGYKPMVLWDGRAQWRFDLHGDYKSNRDSDPKKAAIKDAYVEQRPFIARALEHLGVRQMTAETHEADDLAGYLVAQLSQNSSNEIILITGDKDWIQLVRPNVAWHDGPKIVTHTNILDKTGFASPYAFLEGKCLQGDSSDCIPGVGGIGEKGAPEFLAEFGSVRRFWQACADGSFKPTKKAHIKLAGPEGRQIFGRNLRLMQLLKVPAPERAATQVKPGCFDREKFAGVCEELAFVSLLKNLSPFLKVFEGR